LYKDKELTDFTIKCSTHDIQCHKVVLCSQSPYFKAMLVKPFLVRSRFTPLSTLNEAQTSTCDFTKENPHHVTLMVDFLYDQRYDSKPLPSELSPTSSKPSNTYKALLHFSLYVLADRFNIPSLQDYACGLFIQEINALAGDPLSRNPLDAGIQLPTAPEAFALVLSLIPEIFSMGPRQDHPLRPFVIKFLVDRSKRCLMDSNKKKISKLMDNTEFREDFWEAHARMNAHGSLEETPTTGRSEASASRADEEVEEEQG
ncbi:MAG: hypothetical protein Q9183_003039, partial [Haloplaca sp. 2 TL-2023]